MQADMFTEMISLLHIGPCCLPSCNCLELVSVWQLAVKALYIADVQPLSRTSLELGLRLGVPKIVM